MIRFTPPRKFIRSSHKGSAVLALVIVCGIFSSMMGLSSAKVSSATNSSLSSSKTSAQALQYAETQAGIVRNTAYDDLSSKAKTQIAGTHFYEEVTVGAETAYKEDIKKKDCTVNVYSGSETIPRATLTITRLTKEENQASGVPVGTVITWASAKNPTDGTWLDCNGQSCAGYAELVSILGKSTVPDYRNRFLEGSVTPGTVLEAGLPDISGTFGNHGHDQDGDNGRGGKRTSGAFKIIQSWCRPSAGRDSNGGNTVLFQASLSNSIYGRSSTVQPPAVTVRYLIKAA